MSEVTHSGLPTAARRFQPRGGEGGYLRREPRQLLPRRDGLRGQLRAHVGEGGIEHVARQHGAQQQIRIRRMLRQLLEYGRGDGGVTVAAAVEDRAHGADILAVGVRAVAVGDEELDVRAAAMMSVLANTAQRLCQLALMRGESAAAQRAVLEQRPLDGARAHVNSQLEHSFLLLLDKSN